MMRLIAVFIVFFIISAADAQRLPRFTLRKTDQNIFGTYVLYDRLPDFYPFATITVNNKSPEDLLKYSYLDNTALFYIAPSLDFTKKEIDAFEEFTDRGNVLVLSSSSFGEEMEKWLNIKTVSTYNLFGDFLRDSLSVWNGNTSDFEKFLAGRSIYSSYIKVLDSLKTNEYYGRDTNDSLNFVMLNKGKGFVILQTQPYMFSNFHLLNKKTKGYTELFFSALPAPITNVIWDEWSKDADRNSEGPLKYIMSQPALRNAFWWALAALLLLVFLSLKRRQRVVKELPVNNNTTVDMVRTISDLYFFSHANKVMAKKKIAHWYEFLRTRHNIHQNQSVEAFWQAVRKRTDLSEGEFKTLEIMVTRYRHGDVNPDDNNLIELTKLLDTFYKV